VADFSIPFDQPRPRRYTTKGQNRSETDVISCRAPSLLLRQIDEIIASKVEPDLKTKSDVLNDAIKSWLERFYNDHPGELQALKDRFDFSLMKWTYENREADLDEMREWLEVAKKDRNLPLLHVVLLNAHRFKTDLAADGLGSPAHLMQCESVIKDVNETMSRFNG
jgi:hypothetical protein